MQVKSHFDVVSRQEIVGQGMEWEKDCLDDLELSRMKHLAAYHYYTNAQDLMQRNHAVEKIMTRAFRRLQGVRSITITRANGYIGAKEIFRSFKYLDGQVLSMGAEHPPVAFLYAVSRAEMNLEAINLGSFSSNDETNPAANDPQLNKRKGAFPLNEIYKTRSMPIERALDRSSLPTAFFSKALRQLTIMDPFVDHDGSPNVKQLTVTRELLNNSLELNEVCLANVAYASDWDRADGRVLAPLFSPDWTCRTLTVLALVRFECSLTQITGLLNNNAQTIEYLEFHNLKITGNEDWSMALTSFRDLPFNKLKSLELRRHQKRKQSERLISYVRRNGDAHPLETPTSQVSHLVKYVKAT
ncbi:uncharacterized protein KY384_004730 [Bacidia gigantensis]|uniref:uncharacterized protein n=1 Tax=Bacidia gigantensis TaxID=2732470 RepID=UPI001D03AEF0|nr:uncharacterized protein KY384_004730 [Bacidia gigantensis]KAG8530230.1 hypothetical protein KY384_004730 [Bacidia gigantensis]